VRDDLPGAWASGGTEPRAPLGGNGDTGAPPLTRTTACTQASCGRAPIKRCLQAFQWEIPYLLDREHRLCLCGTAVSASWVHWVLA